MGILDRFKKADINEGVRRFKAESRAVLLDVRTREEFASGHIPRSRNLPLAELNKAESTLPEKDMPIYVYCEKGSRASQAVKKLVQMGYSRVENIGGIEKYSGKKEGAVTSRNRAMNNTRAAAARQQMNEPWNKGIGKMR